IWRRKVLRYLLMAGTLAVAGQAGISAFMAPFVIRVHHLPIGQVGLLVGLTLGLGGLIGMPLGGVFSDWSDRRSAAGGIRMAALVILAAVPVAVSGFLAPSLFSMVPAIGVALILISFYYGATFSTFLGHTPVPMRGAALAFMIVAMNLGGYGLGPQYAGALSDLLRHLGVAEPLRWALVGVTGFFVCAGILFLLARRAIEQEQATAAQPRR